MSIRIVFLLVICALVSACAQLEVVAPNPRIEIPETRGDGNRWKFGANLGGSHVVQSTTNGGARPPDLTEGDSRAHAEFGPQVQFAAANRLEVGVEILAFGLAQFGSGMAGFARWQILGEGSNTAKKGAWPFALYTRLGQSSGTQNGDQESTFGPGGYPWKGHMYNTFAHAGFSFGYRPTDHLLVFGGAAYGRYWLKTKIDQDPTNSGGGDPGGSYRQSDDGHAGTVGGGVLFNWTSIQFWVGLEGSYIDYTNTDPLDHLFVNTGFAFTP